MAADRRHRRRRDRRMGRAGSLGRRRGRGEPDAEQVYVPVWVCLDPSAAGLHYAYDPRNRATGHDSAATGDAAEQEAEAEARRAAESAERRRVIANNKAWKAAEVVRR